MKRAATYDAAITPRQIARDLRSMIAGELTEVRCGDYVLRNFGFSTTAARIIAKYLERLARLEARKK